MTDRQINLIQHIRDYEGTHKLLKKYFALSDQELVKKIFCNVRVGERSFEPTALRLTNFGFNVLKTVFDFWEIQIDKPLNCKQQLRFARACSLPYVITTSKIGCFEIDVGMSLALIRGNLDLMDNVLPLRVL